MKAAVLIPAAGVGSRFGADVPKQYFEISGKTVLQHTLDVFADNPRIARIAVVVSPEDRFAATLALPENVRLYAAGGGSRAETVRNGVAALLADGWAADAPVLVHDAARCCLPRDALERLLDAADAPKGALLAVPLADTLKRADADACAETTLPREGLWQAQTPQLFQAALLKRALSGDLDGITDEASAVERLGWRPRLVMGDSRNLKLTRPEDAVLAAALLAARAG